MNKRKIGIIVLTIFFVTAVVVYAAQFDNPVFTGRGTSTLTVQNPNQATSRNALTGSVCVYFDDGTKAGGYKDVDYDVPAGQKKDYPIPGKITYWSETYCYVSNRR